MSASRRGGLALAALGVVFGDIGTSPLYAFQTVFAAPHDIAVDDLRLFGALSLIFWTITLIVSVKYVLIVMRADNDGEGGIMALTALTRSLPVRHLGLLLALGVFGAALFYGDSIITPAISVLSAVEGLELVAPELASAVVPIALVVLVALFLAQRFGTHRVGVAFGPVMFVWFVVIGAMGLISVAQTPSILRVISPTYAVSWALHEPLIAFLALGSVILCVTGAEALFADMGHFGRRPIRLAWFALVSIALYLNYLGQGALVMRDPAAIENPFYLLAPQSLQLPLVILATLATVIASQAVISGAFSLTEQAVHLRYLPRMLIKHTSPSARGQIYVPLVNWLLLVAVVLLVIGFRDSERLASAYGLAVSGTFVITTLLITVVAHHKWHVAPVILVPLTALFLFIDLSFFTANLTKLVHGGWFPLAIAALLYVLLMTWSRGRALLHRRRAEIGDNDEQLATLLAHARAEPMPGSAVYLTADVRPPLAMLEYLKLGGTIHRDSIHLAVLSASTVPYVDEAEQLTVDHIAPGFDRARLRLGFMQRADIPTVLRLLTQAGLPVDDNTILVVYTTRVVPRGREGMMLWRKHLFAFMLRNAVDPVAYFRLESGRIIEFTDVVRI